LKILIVSLSILVYPVQYVANGENWYDVPPIVPVAK
jgi:hypothetical protein